MNWRSFYRYFFLILGIDFIAWSIHHDSFWVGIAGSMLIALYVE